MTQTDPELVACLEDKAIDIKKKLFRLTNRIGVAHLGGGLSCTDTAVALYYHALKVDPKRPDWPERDRFVLSKGHMAFLFYVILADKGFFPAEDIPAGYNVINGRFGMHPNRKYVPGIEASTGSLGHGLAIAVGMALAGRMDKANHRVFCLIGDGELNEGSNWEAIMAGAKYQLGNLVAIVDQNKLSLGGPTKTIMPMDPLDDKWKAFGWDVIHMNGHDMQDIVETLDALPARRRSR
jgi:transketolase